MSNIHQHGRNTGGEREVCNRVEVAWRWVVGVLFIGFALLSVSAQTWNGGGTNNAWSTASNWVGNTAPVNNGTATAIFGGSTRLTADVDVTWDVKGIQFTNGAGGFTLGGSALTIRANGITNNSANLQTINNNLTLNGAQNWKAGSGNLLISGTVANGGSLLTAGGANAMTIDGIISGTGGLKKVDAGMLTLNGANTFSGTLTLSAGTLALGHDSAAGTGGLTIDGGTIQASGGARTIGNAVTATANFAIGGSANLTFTSNFNLSADRTITVNNTGVTTLSGTVGLTGGSPKVNKAGAGTLVLSASNNIADTITVSAGVLRAQHDSALGTTAFGTTVSDGAALELQGGITMAEPLTLNGTGVSGSGALRSVSGNNTLNGNITFGSSYSVVSDAGTLALGGSVDTSATAGFNVTFGGAGNIAANGSILNRGDIIKTGGGTMTLAAANTFSGAAMINAGVVSAQHSSAFGTTAGGVTVASGAALQLQNNIAVGTEALTLNGSGIAGDGVLRNLSGNNSWAGAVTLGSATMIASDSGTLTLGGNVANGGYGLTVFGSGDVTASGVVSGTGGLTKNGSGVLTLSGTNTYSGGSIINDGVVVINNAASLGHSNSSATMNAATMKAAASFTSSRGLALGSASSTIEVNPTYNLNLSGVLSGAGTLNKTGTGTLTLSNANTFSGGLVANAGTVAFGHNGAAGSGNITVGAATLQAAGAARSITNTLVFTDHPAFGGTVDLTFSAAHAFTADRTFTVDNTGVTAFTGVLGESEGARSLTKGGSGTLLLSGANTFSGGLNVNSGMLALGNNQAAGNGTLALNGGGLRADGAARTVTNAVTLGGDVTIGGALDLTLSGSATLTGNRTLTVTNTGTTTVSGRIGEIGGTRTLTKAGSGALVVSGSNTFSGGVTHNGGTLLLGHDSALGTGTVTLNTATVQASGGARTIGNTFVLGGDAIVDGTLDFTLSGTGTLTGNRTLTVNNSGQTTMAGSLGQDVAGRSLTKAGSGSLTLSASNSFSGGFALNAGTLLIGHNNALGSGTLTLGSASVQATGGSRSVANAVALAGDPTFSGSQDLTFSGLATLTGHRTLTIDNTATTTFSGALGQDIAGRTLTKSGAGTLVLSGATANTNSGAVTVNAGTLVLNKTAGVNAIAGALTIGDGTGGAGADVVRLSANQQIADNAAVTVNRSGRLELNGNSETIGTLTLTGGAVTSGAGTLTLGGNVTGNASSTSATISGNLDLGGATRTFTVASQPGVTDMDIAARISNGALSKAGAGVLSLSGDNTFSGGLTLGAGTLQVGANAAAGSGTLTINAGTIQGDGTARTLANAVTAGGSFTVGGASDLTFSGPITVAGDRTLTVNNSGLTTIAGGFVSSGTPKLIKAGAGTLVLSASNNLADTITLNAGVVSVRHAYALGSTAAGTTVADGAALELQDNVAVAAEPLTLSGSGVAGGGALRNVSGTNSFAGALTLAAASTLSAASGMLTVSGNIGNGGFDLSVTGPGNTTLSGLISGAGTLTKTGSGTLILSGSAANNYTGNTAVNEGMVYLNKNVTDGAIIDTVGIGDAAGGVGADIVRYGADNQLKSGSGSGLTLTKSGWLDLNDHSDTVKFTSIEGGKITTGSGTLTLASHLVFAATNQTATISGNVNLGANRDFTVNDGAPSIDADVSAVLSGAFDLDKKGAGALRLSGANTHVGGTLLTLGTLILAHDQAAGSGAMTWTAGTLQGDGGARTFTNSVTLAGNLTLGGAVDMNFTGPLTLTADRTLTVNNTGLTTFSGAVGQSSSGYSLTKNGNGVLALYGSNTFNGGVTINAGTVLINNAASLGANAAATLNAATLRATETLTSTRNFTLGAANSTVEVDGTKIFTVNGVMNGTGGLVKTGNGTLIVGGNNTFGGNVSVNAGTLLLGSSNRIANGSSLVLNGGTFATGGFSESMSNLTLTANSIIDFGAGSSVLRFTNSSALAWTPGTTLILTNWSGSPWGGGTDQLYFGTTSSGLTAGQLSQIQFVGPNNYVRYGTILASGEVVPSPEPATWAGIVAVISLLTWRERKRLKSVFGFR